MAKVQLELLAKDKASAKVKGLTSSIIKSQLAIDAIKFAFKKLVEISDKAIDSFVAQEKQLAQLNATLKSTNNAVGLTANEISDMASAFQETTKFADDAILRGQNMLLTFTKIGGEVFPQATEAILNMSEAMGTDLQQQAIQVGKALNDPIQGVTALRLVGVQLSKQQEKMIRDFMAVGDVASAQKIILGELETQFGGVARAAADTFGGALKQLENVNDDNLEAIGKIVSIVGVDFVNSMIDGQKAINDFLTDAENISNIAASLEVLRVMVTDLAKKGFEALKEAIQPIEDALTELFTTTEEGNIGFQILGAVLQTVNTAFAILGQFLKTVITFWVDLIKTVGNAINILGDFYQAVKGEKEWSEVQDQALKTVDTIVNLGKNLKDNFSDVITTTIDEFKALPKNVELNAKDLEKVWSDTNKRIKEDFAKTQDEITDSQKKGGKDRENNQKKETASWKDWFSNMKSIAEEALGAIQEIHSSFYADRLTIIQESQEQELESVQGWIDKQMEMQGVQEESQSERLEREIQELEGSIQRRTSATDKAAIQDQLKEKQDQLTRQKILDAAEKKKQKIREKAKKEETALKKKQFEENKAFSIAQVWINAASATLGWWSSFAPMGIPGVVLAAVMTAATLAQAGAQTGLIASQTFHGQEGGEIPVGTTTGDRAVTFMNKGEALLRNDDYQALVAMARGETTAGGADNIIIENMTVIANNPEQLAEQLVELRRQERTR